MEAMVLVGMTRNGGGGERSEAEIARDGRVAEGLRGKETEREWSSRGVGLGFLRRSRFEEGEKERRVAMTVRGCDLCEAKRVKRRKRERDRIISYVPFNFSQFFYFQD